MIVPLTYKDVEVESEEVDLSEQEISIIKRLVGNSSNLRYGLMPILENDVPEIYEKLWRNIEQPLRNTVLEDGRKNGYIDEGNEDGGLEIDCVDFICQIPDFAR